MLTNTDVDQMISGEVAEINSITNKGLEYMPLPTKKVNPLKNASVMARLNPELAKLVSKKDENKCLVRSSVHKVLAKEMLLAKKARVAKTHQLDRQMLQWESENK